MRPRLNTPSVLARALLVLGAWASLGAPGAVQAAAPAGFAVCASVSSPVTGAVTLSADVGADPRLVGVQFKIDGHPVDALDTTAPFEIVWSAASTVNGEYTITAEARYASGEVVESAPLQLTVANPTTRDRTLHVDAVGGDDAYDGLSPTTPWRTLERANQAVVAGDTVLLLGTFVHEAIRPLTSGTADRPITFRSAPGATAVLHGGLLGAAVWLDGARSHVIVEGLALVNTTLTGVFLSEGAHHNVIRNCDLAGVEIRIYDGASDNVIESNVIGDVGSEAANEGDAIWIANGASRNRILYNRVTNGGHTLVHVGGDRPGDAEVVDNVVAYNVLSNRWATPLLLTWRARRTLVEANHVSDGARNGVVAPRPGIQIAASDNVIRYNAVFDNAGAGIHLGGYVFRDIAQDSIGNQIYHNVFYGNGTAAGGGTEQAGVAVLVFEKDGRAVRDNVLANNVFFRNRGFAFAGAVYSVVIEHFHTPAAWPEGSLNGNRFSHNIFLREPGAAGEPSVLRIRRADQGGNLNYTLAQLEAVHAEAADNMEVDPRFTDEANRVFTLQAGSPAIDAGALIAGVQFEGEAPDIGVFELTSDAAGGLVAAYGFDEDSGLTTTDASGHDRTATIAGATWTRQGRFGGALAFDGLQAHVRAGTVTLGPPFTLMAWVFNTGHAAYQTIMTVGSARDLFLRDGVIAFYDGETECLFGSAVSTDAWHHVALVYDGATLRAYLNGRPQGTAESVTLPAVTGPLQIGAWIHGASSFDFFGGRIDDVRVYDRALTEAELRRP